jgi:hypothetical protein
MEIDLVRYTRTPIGRLPPVVIDPSGITDKLRRVAYTNDFVSEFGYGWHGDSETKFHGQGDFHVDIKSSLCIESALHHWGESGELAQFGIYRLQSRGIVWDRYPTSGKDSAGSACICECDYVDQSSTTRDENPWDDEGGSGNGYREQILLVLRVLESSGVYTDSDIEAK